MSNSAGDFVTYSKPMKNPILGVPMQLLQKPSAVCAAVAEAMAQGAIERSAASVGVSVTGITGPKPGENGHPVGLSFYAAVRRGQTPRTAHPVRGFPARCDPGRRGGRKRRDEALTLLRPICVA